MREGSTPLVGTSQLCSAFNLNAHLRIITVDETLFSGSDLSIYEKTYSFKLEPVHSSGAVYSGASPIEFTVNIKLNCDTVQIDAPTGP